MELGRNSDMVGQGSGGASCADTAATGCGGEMHNANTITAGNTQSIKKVWVDQNCNDFEEITQSLGWYTKQVCKCDEDTEHLRNHRGINSSQLMLHHLFLTKRTKEEMFPKQSTKEEKSRKTNGSRSIISMIAIAKKKKNNTQPLPPHPPPPKKEKNKTGKKWYFICKNVSVMYYCRNTTATTKRWVIWHSSHCIHWSRWSSDALANETGLKKQPAACHLAVADYCKCSLHLSCRRRGIF